MSLDSQIASAVVAALDDETLDLLADRLASRLTSDASGPARPVAYTVATLAAEVGLSQRAIRGAIERGELAGVKRSGRWLVSAESVEAWLAPAPTVARAPAKRRGAVSSSALADLAARIDRAEDERGAGQRGRPPVRLSDTNTKRPRQRANATGVLAKGETPPMTASQPTGALQTPLSLASLTESDR